MNAALLWAMDRESPSRHHRDGQRRHERHTGYLASTEDHSASELVRLSVGEVLVCLVTSPTWTVAFDLIGEVVADGGGALSHAAMLAREHGIPAVLGTTATHDLCNGQIVTVDGTHRTVADGQGHSNHTCVL